MSAPTRSLVYAPTDLNGSQMIFNKTKRKVIIREDKYNEIIALLKNQGGYDGIPFDSLIIGPPVNFEEWGSLQATVAARKTNEKSKVTKAPHATVQNNSSKRTKNVFSRFLGSFKKSV